MDPNFGSQAYPNAPANQYMTPAAPSNTAVNNSVNSGSSPQPAPNPTPQLAPIKASPIPQTPAQPIAPVASRFSQVYNAKPQATTPSSGFHMPSMQDTFGIPKAEAQTPDSQSAPQGTSPIVTKDYVQNLLKTQMPSDVASHLYQTDPNFAALTDKYAPILQAQGPDWRERLPTFAINQYYGIDPSVKMDPSTQALAANMNNPNPPQPPWQKEHGPSFLDTVGQGLMAPFKMAGDMVMGAAGDIQNGAQDIASQATHVSDIHDNAGQMFAKNLIPTMGAMGATATNVITEPIKPIFQPLINAVAGSQQGQQAIGAIQKGMEQLQASHPELARQIIGLLKLVSFPLAVTGTAGAINTGTNIVKNLGQDAIEGLPNAINNVKDFSTSTLRPKVPSAREVALNANAQYEAAQNVPRTTTDLAMPKLQGRALDSATTEGRIITQPNVNGEDQIVGQTPSNTHTQIAKSLDNVPGIKNPDGSVVAPEKAIPLTNNRIGQLYKDVRSDLETQSTAYPTAKFLKQGVTEFRSTLSDASTTPEARLAFSGSGEPETLQNVSNITEDKYAELLKQNGGQKDLASLDTKHWIDGQLSSKDYQTPLDELSPTKRALIVNRNAISDSLAENSAARGESYAPKMKEMSNLYKAMDNMQTQVPNKAATLEQQFKLDSGKPLNEVPESLVKGTIKKGAIKAAKKIAGGALVGLGFNEISHITH
jgi:hypothetical protein